MINSMKTTSTLLCLLLLSIPVIADEAADILELANYKGGLLVHVDCADGRLTKALFDQAQTAAPGSSLVLGLARDPESARKRLRNHPEYGQLSVDAWDGRHIPLVDNTANLIVIRDAGSEIPDEELKRILAPGGKIIAPAGSRIPNPASRIEKGFVLYTEPIPSNIDEWTHYLHGPDNNAVAHDDEVAPPHHLQWVGSPKWTRHHDHMSSFNAMVSAGGRVFYIIDLGPRAEVQLPSTWMLVCRDAFNGVQLWQREIDHWHSRLWHLKSGPAQIPRRLVAIDNRVYVTLGINAPVSVLDATSGKTLRTLKGTEGTEEILCADGMLYLVINPKAPRRPWATKEYANLDDVRGESELWTWKDTPRRVVALDAATGNNAWSSTSPVLPMTLTVDGDRVYYHDGSSVVALDRPSGRKAWSSKPVERAQVIRSWFAPTLVAQDGVLVFSGGANIKRHKGGIDSMTALDAKTGEVLWTAPHPASGYDSPEDVFIIDGIVWTAPLTNKRDTGFFTGRDLRTGKVVKTFPANDGVHMPHHRCHRAKATDNYVVASRTGIEYVDLEAESWDRNDWVRGACLYGVVPANGLTYAPPHSCACYITAKLNGLNALAAKRAPGTTALPRRVVGPADAFGRQGSAKTDDWPTFRADPARSGRVDTSIPALLKQSWQTKLGGRLSSPVSAEGCVFVAAIDAHTVHALDAASGKALWSFTAGGRVDSPPTIWNERVLFGCADGSVYCLRANDGALAWRFRAAPNDLRLHAWEQLESVWPVHGSVLVVGDEVHCVAGRSMFLDGGLRYIRLKATTGKLISDEAMNRINPDTGKPLDANITWPNLPVALSDVLSCDGQHIYLRSQVLDMQGQRIKTQSPTNAGDQKGQTAHLFSPTGLLDDSWWHRTYWMFGKQPLSGAGGWYRAAYEAPAGRIMAFDDKLVYAFGRRAQYFPRTTALEYHLYAASRQPDIVSLDGKKRPKTASKRPPPSRPVYSWSHVTPVLGRALVIAGDTLFVAGPPDVVDQEASLSQMALDAAEKALARQRDAYQGKEGGILLAVSVSDGSKQAAYALDTIPVFSGMAAAAGRLFMSTVDGRVIGFGAKGKALPTVDDLKVEPTPAAGATGSAASTPALTTTHKDFNVLRAVSVKPCELGWRVQAPRSGVGFALRKLPREMKGPVSMKARLVMIPNAGAKEGKPPPGNAFIAFGASPKDADLVKCGLRSSGQCALIIEGPLMTGANKSLKISPKVNEPIDVAITYDPSSGKVVFSLLGKTMGATLRHKPESISWVGYAVNSVASEFGPIDIE